MNKIKKILVLVLVAAIVSLGLTACKEKSEHPTADQPSGDQPTKETVPEEHPAEHPAGEHPTGEHPE